jgi:hypothetical protein
MAKTRAVPFKAPFQLSVESSIRTDGQYKHTGKIYEIKIKNGGRTNK